jgi:hypothetical protein
MECFKDAKVFEKKQKVSVVADRDDVHSMVRPVNKTCVEKKIIRVYHVYDDAYICVQVDRPNQPPVYYFNILPTIEVTNLFNATNIEIYEGRIPKYDFKSGKDTWEKLLASFTQVDRRDGTLIVSSIRSRYLILSRIGPLAGFSARFEFFENKQGEVAIIIHGLHNGKSMHYLVDTPVLTELDKFADTFHERGKLEDMDAVSTAAIVADRLQVRHLSCAYFFIAISDMLDIPNTRFLHPLNITTLTPLTVGATDCALDYIPRR